MTSPYVTFPHAAPRRSAWPVLRAMLAVAVLLGGLLCAAVAGFAALVTWSGCFIECRGANHQAGGALALLAVVLLAAGPAIVAALYRSIAWLWVAGFAAAAGAVLMALGLSTN